MTDLEFAFNDEDFSDRMLRVETISDDDDLDSDGCGFVHNPNKDKLVTSFHINSPILAASSPFFFKLFKNGMRESSQRHVTLRINPSEEAALEDVLKFMYTKKLRATSAPDLLNVLMVADRFEVTSCVTECSELLMEKDLSLESALLYLELPSSVLKGGVVEPLKDLAKKYIVQVFKDFTKSEEEAMALPLSTLEVVFGTDGLKLRSEDHLYTFILKWARAHYPKQEERREVLTKRLARFIYFPYLSTPFLNDIQVCADFDTQEVSKLVLQSLHLNAGYPYGQHIRVSEGSDFIKRVYECHPLKAVPLESTLPQCVVYLYLTMQELDNLFTSKEQPYQGFYLDEKWFFLLAKCTHDENTSLDHLSLLVNIGFGSGSGSGMCTFDYEFSVLKKAGYQSKHKVEDCAFMDGKGLVGSVNLLGVPWTYLTRIGSEYLIDGILHLRAGITIKSTQS